ncbi:hypothetical protein COO60DRAFT_1465019 [Scenedesmus sp. NREL 46B-D3]|nr:hypothetical protein COO60DRAFT_1465019 [Scenedesmus sp. NREL 46B-D3]
MVFSCLPWQQQQPGSEAGLPTLDSIVLVEGDQDQRAVARAVNAPVYVCDGTRVLKEHVKPELAMLQQLGRPLVVLTDPDERGRELRLHLEAAMGPLLHAFVPEPAAAALVDGPVHGVGNRGIEHVVPVGVQQALKGARLSFAADRQVWGMERLRELRLANAYDDADGVVHGPGGAADRRRQLCALLGLGRCSGAQLLTALNRFFDEETVMAALAQLATA